MAGPAPVLGGFGAKLLKKMGWSDGEGLGKRKQGRAEPVGLDKAKLDPQDLSGAYARTLAPRRPRDVLLGQLPPSSFCVSVPYPFHLN